MQHFSQSSFFCVHPPAAAGLRQAFLNDRNGEILLCVTLPCIKERLRGWGTGSWVSQMPELVAPVGREAGDVRFRRDQPLRALGLRNGRLRDGRKGLGRDLATFFAKFCKC